MRLLQLQGVVFYYSLGFGRLQVRLKHIAAHYPFFDQLNFRYRFLYINVGAPGRCNDSGIYEKSKLKQNIENSNVLQDLAKNLNGVNVPAVIMGDSAFRLSRYLVKPYPFYAERSEEQKYFNYRLSKCRRVVENAFGHLKARFRRIGKGIENSVKYANLIIKACCVLHNFLNEANDDINSTWSAEMAATATRSFSDNVPVEDENISGEEIRRAIATYLGKNFQIKANLVLAWLSHFIFLNIQEMHFLIRSYR